jgi:hypothetical protein
MRDLQTSAMSSNRRPHTRNEQVSGSIPLVGYLLNESIAPTTVNIHLIARDPALAATS